MAEKGDYYALLGISRDATSDEIRSAYRKAALRHHPDRNQGDPEAERRFKEVSEAYDVLSDEKKRALYDQRGHDGLRGEAVRDWTSATFRDVVEAFGDIFEGGAFGDFFGVSHGRRIRRRGANLRVEVAIELREAASGTRRTVELARHETCATCAGSGAAPGTSPVPCGPCGGRGVVGRNAGFFVLQQTCPACGGEGTRTAASCPACRGARVAAQRRDIEIGIPAGVADGARLRLAGQGEGSPDGGEPGDLYCDVRVREHPTLKREGNDLHCAVQVPFGVLVLGGDVEVATLDGKAALRIPKGTQNGAVFRMRGLGMPGDGRRRGDQLVRAEVLIPTRVTRRQEELLREFEDAGREPGGKSRTP